MESARRRYAQAPEHRSGHSRNVVVISQVREPITTGHHAGRVVARWVRRCVTRAALSGSGANQFGDVIVTLLVGPIMKVFPSVLTVIAVSSVRSSGRFASQ
jgi:hypothetical protein